MTYSGYFNTYDNNYTYYVQIGPTIPNTMPIRDPLDAAVYSPATGTVVMFDPDPVTLSCDRQDLQKRIIISQATINLLSNENLTPFLFADTNRSIPVTITRDNQTVFFGYVDPLQFNQGYAHNWESIQITATDPLGALENLTIDKLDNVDSTTVITPANLITKIFAAIGINGVNVSSFSSDINASVLGALTGTNINMSIMFGDSEDDRMTLYEALEEICKYFNLYVSYYAGSVHITCTINYTPSAVNITNFKDKADDDSTSLSTDEVYSQVNLTCDIDPVDDTLVDISDKDYLRSDYDYQQRYMTEYICEGDGKTAFNAMCSMLHHDWTDYDAAYTYQYYCYVKRNDAWKFGGTGITSYIDYLWGTEGDNPTPCWRDQRMVLKWLKENPCKGALISFGKSDKISRINDPNDRQVSLTDYLVISINGTCTDGASGGSTMSSYIQAGTPICSYEGLTSDILSPPDDKIINYLVITGNILLNPLQPKSGRNWGYPWPLIVTTPEKQIPNFNWPGNMYYNTTTNTYNQALIDFGDGMDPDDSPAFYHTVSYSENKWGSYYVQRYHLTNNDEGIYGDLGNSKNQQYKYEGTKVNNIMTDAISKLPILACEFKVTMTETQLDENDQEIEVDVSKYCVERLDLGKEGIGLYEWYTLAELDALNDRLEYTGNDRLQPYFTIGIDIDIDQFVIGKSYQIQNNDNYKLNIDTTGTAIPIKASDRLSGPVTFKILGPYNTKWDGEDEGEAYPSFIYYAFKYLIDHTNIPLLQHIQSILIKNFKISVVSNNGMISKGKNQADNDLVYASNTNPMYIEKMDEEVKYCTPLTFEECNEKGIKYQISNSYIYKTDNTPFLGFFWYHDNENDKDVYIKPEQCLVDYYYKEYSTPAKMVETSVKSTTFANGMYGSWLTEDMMKKYITGIYPEDNTPYRIMKYEQDLKAMSTDITLRQYKTYDNQQIPT